MQQDEITALFDQQAPHYDTHWAKTAAIRDCLNLLVDGLFASLPNDAHILCVGVGTGDELLHLARKNPGWCFTAVEPSGAMLAICRKRAEHSDVILRCEFYQGFLNEVSSIAQYDAATCFLVSQFILERADRIQFFRSIADRLKPNGLLASADLAAQVTSPEFDVLLRAWMKMTSGQTTEEGLARMRNTYTNDVGVLPPSEVSTLIKAGGFDVPIPFFQAGLIHGWLASRAGF
ncbi:class I SAM-dependent methyltransferase [Gilvimarinus polysaccharolyticus]|uniref:class I SAM-dependent methyltransferase n=1 Tax=Gilvimarinus polysaccharolyticus TaxID=863921 RepID=UPI0006733C02|nr:class I SAM-dependent methyltransferase [Gilvimarinus polysaccharolyticus]